MTEQEWLASTDPQRMISALQGGPRHPPATRYVISARKLRLFACACGKPEWDWRYSWVPSDFPISHCIQAALLRDICGNPFRPVRWDRHGNCWLTPTVLAVAQAIYDEKPCKVCGGRGWLYETNEVEDPDSRVKCRRCNGEQAFDRMPVLGDALEEAGCDSEDVLRHCRGEERVPITAEFAEQSGSQAKWMDVPLRGQHVRGCHVLDLILALS
jgi:hypothetical protein